MYKEGETVLQVSCFMKDTRHSTWHRRNWLTNIQYEHNYVWNFLLNGKVWQILWDSGLKMDAPMVQKNFGWLPRQWEVSVNSRVLEVAYNALPVNLGVVFREYCPVPMHLSVLSTFSSMRFSVVSFMLRSLIKLGLSFVHGDRYGTIFLPLHVDIHLYQLHLLNMLSAFHFSLFPFHHYDS